MRWVVLLQEFVLEIKDKKDSENSVADHLSRIYVLGGGDIGDTFFDEHLLAISSHAPLYAHIVNFTSLDQSQSIGIVIKKISSSMISSNIFEKNHSYST